MGHFTGFTAEQLRPYPLQYSPRQGDGRTHWMIVFILEDLLRLWGFYPRGAVKDRPWTDELTAALMAYQQSLPASPDGHTCFPTGAFGADTWEFMPEEHRRAFLSMITTGEGDPPVGIAVRGVKDGTPSS